jgi:small-conductance mechanosensitive channel
VHPAPTGLLSAFAVALIAAVTAVIGLPVLDVLAAALATAVLCGALAHRIVGNLFAGLVLTLIRPYAPGEKLRLFSPVRGCVVEAEIVRIGAANTTLATTRELIVVPNNTLLRSTPQPDDAPTCA